MCGGFWIHIVRRLFYPSLNIKVKKDIFSAISLCRVNVFFCVTKGIPLEIQASCVASIVTSLLIQTDLLLLTLSPSPSLPRNEQWKNTLEVTTDFNYGLTFFFISVFALLLFSGISFLIMYSSATLLQACLLYFIQNILVFTWVSECVACYIAGNRSSEHLKCYHFSRILETVLFWCW